MKIKSIISVVLTVLMIASVIPFATISSSAVTATKYETAAHEIDKQYRYDGNDLGATYSKESTTFKVWAPTATKCILNLYATGSDTEEGAADLGTHEMSYDEQTGVWSVKVDGDLKNVYYTYSVTAKSIGTDVVTTKETTDVYSVAAGVNGMRSMVCDLDSTDPEGWENDKHVVTADQSDASIWEIHVKDFTYSPSSGVSEKNRGKYLGFTEKGTTLNGDGKLSTCIDYLKDLGVTHVQLNPIYDFGSVDESGSDAQFNWGYDPMNYNVPEGSYSSNPYDGNVRIKECKQMIQALHEAGISVIMDVVYNHTYNTSTSFQACVPDYYYRKTAADAFSSGSGCGNDTASERAMYRNFMIQSTKYWAEEYHIDGFRFDLMGLHDTKTMNLIRQSFDTIDENMMMYGEGWSMSTTQDQVDCDGEKVTMCTQGATRQLDDRIGMFNDQFRDAMKGSFSSATAKGFVQGNIVGNAKGVKYGIRANTAGSASNWKAYSPAQCVNYVSCHDNNTLYDKLGMSLYGTNFDYRSRDAKVIALNKFAQTICATSQGMHFMLAGEEMGRSKDGDDNSYKSPATENMIDWNNIRDNADLVSYYKGMMDIRKAFSPFTTDNKNIGLNQYILDSALTTETDTIAYTASSTVKGEWDKIAVLMNSKQNEAADISLSFDSSVKDDTEWVVIANSVEAGLTAIETVKGKTITVPAASALVLVEKSTFDACAIKNDKSKVKVVNKDIDTGKTISTNVLYGKVGDNYIAQADPTLEFEYILDNVEGNAEGKFTENDQTVTFNYKEYVPETLTTVLTGRDTLTIKDATLIQKASNGDATLTDEQKAIADYDMDGSVTVKDATLVQKYVNRDDYGAINTLTIRYLSATTKKTIAEDKTVKILAGKEGTFEPIDIVGYKYSYNSVSDKETSATIQYKFSNALLLFYYDDDNYEVTLHAKHNGSAIWVPTLWAWHDFGNCFTKNWPGENMVADGDGWYTKTFNVPNGLGYSIIINNNGSTQSQDYTGITGSEKWVVIDDSKITTGGNFLKFYDSKPEV